MEKEELLLGDDRILLERFDKDFAEDMIAEKRRLLRIQVEATLRSRKTMVDLDKSNGRFSRVVGVLALIQLVVACFQFVFDVGTSGKGPIAVISGFTCLGLIWLIVRDMNKELRQ